MAIIIIIYYSESYFTVHLTTTNVSSCNSLFFISFFIICFLNILSIVRMRVCIRVGLAINFYLVSFFHPFPFPYSLPPLSLPPQKNTLYLF